MLFLAFSHFYLRFRSYMHTSTRVYVNEQNLVDILIEKPNDHTVQAKPNNICSNLPVFIFHIILS